MPWKGVKLLILHVIHVSGRDGGGMMMRGNGTAVMTTRRGIFRGAAGLAVLAAGVSACDDRKKPTGAAAVLRVGDQRGGLQALLSAFPDDKAGLDYDLVWAPFPNAAPLVEALNAQAIDIGGVGDAPFGFGLVGHARIKAVSAYRSSASGTALLVRPETAIRTAADLAGRTLATSKGSIGHFLVLRALASAGLEADAVKLAFLSPNDAKAALLTGSVDGWATWDPYTALAELHDSLRVLVDGQGRMPGLSYLLSTPAALADRQALLRDFVNRVDRARTYVSQQPDSYAAVFTQQTRVPLDAAQRMMRRTDFKPVSITLALIAEQQEILDVFAQAGLGGEGINVTTAFQALT